MTLSSLLLALALVAADAPAAPAAGAPRPSYVLLDESGEPLPGARVSLVGRSGAVMTAADGSFRIDPDPIPPFRLIVFDESGALIGTVNVLDEEGAAAGRFVMSPARVDVVRVLSGVAPTIIAPPASAPTVVSREEREQTRPTRLVDVLPEIPGASRSGTGQTAVPTLRGLAGGRTLILLDDARVTAERRAGPSATYLDPFALERIEIVRGPGSVAYGSDALGGVIHARTPDPDPSGTTGRFELGGGVGEEHASGAFEVNVPLGKTSALLVQGHQRAFSDYDSPEGRQENSSARDRGFLARALIPAGRARLLLGVQVDEGRDIERPADDTGRRVTENPEEDSERFTLAVDFPTAGGFEGIELRAFAGSYRVSTERNTFATATDPLTVSRSEVDAKDASLRLLARRPLGDGTLRLGVDAHSRFDLLAADGEVERPVGAPRVVVRDQTTIEDAESTSVGAFAEVDHAVVKGRLSLAGGIRGDRVETENRGGLFGDETTSNSSVSGYAALRARIAEGWEGSVQIARGFRDPRLSDRYFAGVTGRGVVTGNPDLEPETSRHLDLAVQGREGKLGLAAYAYLYRIDDLIERFETAPREFAFRNRAEQEIVGVEIEADVGVTSTLSLRATAAWARGEILDDGSDPSDIPSNALTASLHHRPVPELWWRAGARFVERDDRPGPTEKETPGYAVLDAGLGYAFTDALELRVTVRNLLDKRYPYSQDDAAPLAPGRSTALFLSGRF